MIILPAIDLKDGKCVRLTKGEFSTAEQVAEDAAKTALMFEAAGAEWLHMVDLDGAVAGKPMNHKVIEEVAGSTSLKIEAGGGIRTEADIDYYLSKGVYRVILGSVALNDPGFVRKMVEKYGEKIIVGIDAKRGRVKSSGWLEDSEVDYIDLAAKMRGAGVSTVIFTDIDRDGTLTGPNFDQLELLNTSVDINVIASGGIRDTDDLKKLDTLGMAGAILGKSIYKGTIELSEALHTCANRTEEKCSQKE